MSVDGAARIEEDIEVGSSSGERVSTSHWHNELFTFSKCYQSIKKIDVLSGLIGLGGGMVGSIIGSNIAQGIPVIVYSVGFGSLGGFIFGSLKCVCSRYIFLEENEKTTIISSIAIATIAGCIIALPMGALISNFHKQL